MLSVFNSLHKFYKVVLNYMAPMGKIPILTEQEYFSNSYGYPEFNEKPFEWVLQAQEKEDKPIATEIIEEKQVIKMENKQNRLEMCVNLANDYFSPELSPAKKKQEPPIKLSLNERLLLSQKPLLFMYSSWITAFLSLFLISTFETYFLHFINLRSIYIVKFLVNLLKFATFCYFSLKSIQHRLFDSIVSISSLVIVSMLMWAQVHNVFSLYNNFSNESLAYTCLYILRMIDLIFIFSLFSKQVASLFVVGYKKYNTKFMVAVVCNFCFLFAVLIYIDKKTFMSKVLLSLDFPINTGLKLFDLTVKLVNSTLFFTLLLELALYVSMYLPYLMSYHKEEHIDKYNSIKNTTVLYCRIFTYFTFIAAIALFASYSKRDYNRLQIITLEVTAFGLFNFLSFWKFRPGNLMSRESSNHSLISFFFHLVFTLTFAIIFIHFTLVIIPTKSKETLSLIPSLNETF